VFLLLSSILPSPPQGLVSKTLDQAGAQFAASALITSDQLQAFKAKEEPVPIGVNGVLPGSGGFPVHDPMTPSHTIDLRGHRTSTSAHLLFAQIPP